jgi:hypothetical protein
MTLSDVRAEGKRALPSVPKARTTSSGRTKSSLKGLPRTDPAREGQMSVRRREFIAGLSGAAAWPVVARAQRPAMEVSGLPKALR